MTDDLKKQYEKDLEWNFEHAGEKLIQIPKIISRYQNLYYKYLKEFQKLETETASVYTSRYLSLRFDGDHDLKPNEVKDLVEKDLEYLESLNKTNNLKILLEWIEKCMNNVGQLRWDIKNYLEWKQFISGE